MICFNQKLCYIWASMLSQFNNSENRSIAVKILLQNVCSYLRNSQSHYRYNNR